MLKKYNNIEELIKENINSPDNKEDERTSDYIEEFEDVKNRGFLFKKEFVQIGIWKSPRPQKLYEENSEEDIKEISKIVFSTDNERIKASVLITLTGINIASASAILMLTDPQNYGVIDIRVWQILYLYGVVNHNSEGKNLTINDWLEYLAFLRKYSKEFNVTARTIERTLFNAHKDVQEGNLYN